MPVRYALAPVILLISASLVLAQDAKSKPKDAPKPAPAQAKTEAPKPKQEAPKPKAEPAKPKQEPAKPKTEPAKPKTADAPKSKPAVPAVASANRPKGTVSFLKDVAPILVQTCIACHNPRKAESKYVMTTFAQLAKGGQRGKDITLIPGDPEGSYLVELLLPDGDPRMPYKQDPLTREKIDVISKWVKEGAVYDGADPKEDWTFVLRKTAVVSVPESYPVAVPVTAIAFTPNNAEFWTSGYHETNRWKVADGALAGRLRPLSERIYKIAYSPDGKWLAVASGDPGQFGTVKLWKVEADGKTTFVKDLVESIDCVFALSFSGDSKMLAAAGADRAIRLFEVESGKSLAVIEDHADWIFDIAFSPDGKRLASASRDKTAKVFDVVKKESLVTFPGHAETVYTVGWSKDGKQVLSGGADNQIRVWSPDDDGKQVRNLTGFGGPVFKLIVHPDGQRLIAAGSDKNVRVYVNNSLKHTLSGHNDWVYSLGLSPDGKTIASGSWDGEVRLWNIEDGKPIRSILAAPGLKRAGEKVSAK